MKLDKKLYEMDSYGPKTWLCTGAITMYTILLASASAGSVDQNITMTSSPCDTCIYVDQFCYNVSFLFNLEAPFRTRIVIHKLGILRSKNQLFYSFEPNIDDEEYYKIGFVNMDKPEELGVLTGGKLIMNFGTFDFNQEKNLVYLGGSDGIFVLDINDNKLIPYSSRGDTITSLFFKNNIHFVKSGDNRIVRKKGDNFDTLVENTVQNIQRGTIDNVPITNFVINSYDVIVFLSNRGLFARKSNDTVLLHDNSYFRGLTVDLDGTIYAWWIDGIYKVVLEKNLMDSRVVKVAHIPTIGAMTFDNNNNILFTTEKSLFRLSKTNATVC